MSQSSCWSPCALRRVRHCNTPPHSGRSTRCAAARKAPHRTARPVSAPGESTDALRDPVQQQLCRVNYLVLSPQRARVHGCFGPDESNIITTECVERLSLTPCHLLSRPIIPCRATTRARCHFPPILWSKRDSTIVRRCTPRTERRRRLR